MQIRDRTFLVAGGGSGLGAATVRMLTDNGARVIIADVNTESAEALAADVGDNARFVRTDVCDETQVRAAVTAARDHFDALHGAINCAGVAPAEKVLGRNGAHRLKSFNRTVQINLIGTFNVVRLAVEAMADNPLQASGERGVLINTASIAAFEGQIGQAGYAASKAGVVGLTLPVAREIARYNMRIMTIAPGIFDTPMLAAMPEEVRTSLAKQIPFPQRLGHPAEYAALVRHIIENEMLNGEVIRLDGAVRMGAR